MQQMFDQEHIVILASLLAWVALVIHRGNQICHNKILRLMLMFNIAVIYQCINNPKNVCIVAIVFMVLLEQKHNNSNQPLDMVSKDQNKSESKNRSSQQKLNNERYQMKNNIKFIACLIIILCTQPAFAPVIILKWITLKDSQLNNKMVEKPIFVLIICLLFLTWVPISIFINVYPTNYEPASSLLWLLYSHLFQQYLVLYQMIIYLIPWLTMFPLVFIQAQSSVKIAVCYFVCCFFMERASTICLFGIYILQAQIYDHTMLKLDKNKQIVWNVLTALMVVLSIPTYIFYLRLLWVWQNTHLISVGYFLLQILIFWGTHVVYLSESLSIMDISQDQKQKKERKKIIVRIIQYFKKKIQQM